jgi:flagellar basal body rod protein FlgG
MLYGLYLSATGVLANSHRQDVIANNLANAETVGFKRDLAAFIEERTASQKLGRTPSNDSARMLEMLGGGLNHAPTAVDFSQGPIEPTGGTHDMAIRGGGFFAVRENGQLRLTRDGRFALNRDGHLVTATGGHTVLDEQLMPIKLEPGPVALGKDRQLTQNGVSVTKLGLFDVNDKRVLQKGGQSLLFCPALEKAIGPGSGEVVQGAIENANCEPATELSLLMDAQRQLEANANMIRYQDQTMAKLVNEVGKIG